MIKLEQVVKIVINWAIPVVLAGILAAMMVFAVAATLIYYLIVL